MPTTQQLKVLDLEWEAKKAATLAELGKPFDESHRHGLLDSGLRWAFHYADWCLGWIWRQWLMGTPHEVIREQVGPFVERGLRLRREAHDYEKLPHHDLLLLHCAIFASDAAQLSEVVETVSDVAGDKGTRPADVGSQFSLSCGEFYAAAWCGMMKNAILGDAVKAAEQYAMIWKAKRDQEFVAAPKALTNAWLKQDWRAFINHQKKDFERLWTRARRHQWSVKSETPSEVVVTTRGYRISHMWCWSHCGMALLAHRKGVEVATDPLWFPPHALGGSPVNQLK